MQTYPATANFIVLSLLGCGFVQEWEPNDWHANNASVREKDLHHLIDKFYRFRQSGFGDIRPAKFAFSGTLK